MGLSALAVLSVAATLSGQQQALSDWLVTSQPTLVRSPLGTPAVQFTVENRSAKDVTAWGVNLRCSRPDGTIGNRSYMQESYESYEGLLPADVRSRKVLLSHASITPMVLMSSTECTDVSVSVSFVVFADRTSVGEAREIDEVFAERERISKALTVILAALTAGHAAGGSREGLSVALKYLNSPNQEDFEHSAKKVMRRNLQTALEQEPANIMVNQFLRESIDRTQQSLNAVNKHKR